MIKAKKPFEGQSPAHTLDYRHSFVFHVHQVLEAGYRRLKAYEYAKEEEPAITGELRKAMHEFLRDEASPKWANFFSVHDDPPVNDGERKGKQRNRVDLRVDCSIPRPGSSFSFEAKRLARGFTVAKYLGAEGLGCFLTGEYAKNEDDAGMIGYMQNDNAVYWSHAIETAFLANPGVHQVQCNQNHCLKQHLFPGGPKSLFVSVHFRPPVGRPITIYHALLDFCSP